MLHNIYVCLLDRRRTRGDSISSLSVLSSISIQPCHPTSTSTPPTHPPPQALWQRLALVLRASLSLHAFPPPPALRVTFFVLRAPVIYGRTQEAACVCNCMVTVKSEGGEASIRRPEAAAEISIDFFTALTFALRRSHGGPKLRGPNEMIET